jgi:serine acetyltransferase
MSHPRKDDIKISSRAVVCQDVEMKGEIVVGSGERKSGRNSSSDE